MRHIWLGLQRDEFINTLNEAIEHQSAEYQSKVKAEAVAAAETIPVFPEGTDPNMVILVEFVINAIRKNNERIQEQLNLKPPK